VITAALPLSLFCAGRAEALTITQYGTPFSTGFGNLGPNSASSRSPDQLNTTNQSFLKFNQALGTLTSVVFTGTGTTSGSIRGARSNQSAPVSSLSNGTAHLAVDFGGGGWSLDSGAPTSIFGASSLVVGNSTINTTTGTPITAQTNSLSIIGSSASQTILDLFTGVAGDTIDTTFSWNIALNLLNTGGAKTTNFNFSPTGTGVTSSFSALFEDLVLTYEYEPVAAAVPGPLPLLGSATAFAFSRRLRRRISKVRTTV
jgi:hypothetical protein